MQQHDGRPSACLDNMEARSIRGDIAMLPRAGEEDRLLSIEEGLLAGWLAERGARAQSRADDDTVPIAGVDA